MDVKPAKIRAASRFYVSYFIKFSAVCQGGMGAKTRGTKPEEKKPDKRAAAVSREVTKTCNLLQLVFQVVMRIFNGLARSNLQLIAT